MVLVTSQPHWKLSSKHWKQRLRWAMTKVFLIPTGANLHKAAPHHTLALCPYTLGTSIPRPTTSARLTLFQASPQIPCALRIFP